MAGLLIDAELYLPQSWADDPEQCREAALPEGREYQPKWQLAERQLLRALAVGFDLDWVVIGMTGGVFRNFGELGA